MTIEAQLAELIEINKSMLAAMQSGAQIAAVNPGFAPAPQEAAEKKTRTKKDAKADTATVANEPTTSGEAAMGLVPGDPEGTRYWVSEELSRVYAQKPNDPNPEEASFKIKTADHYALKKADFAKKSEAAAAAQKVADTAPSATPDAATASDVTFTSVVDAIKALNSKLAKTDPAAGRAAVLGVLKEFGCESKTVPALEAVGKNAEILAHVKKLSAAADASGTDDLGI